MRLSAARRGDKLKAAAAPPDGVDGRAAPAPPPPPSAAAPAPPKDGPARAVHAILEAVAERNLDALLEFVPDAALDAALALRRQREAEAAAAESELSREGGQPEQRPKAPQQQQRRRRHQPPAPLTFAEVLEATSTTGAPADGWAWSACGVGGDDDDAAGACEAAADAQARGAAGDDGGDAVEGLLLRKTTPATPEDYSFPSSSSSANARGGGGGGGRRRRPPPQPRRPYWDSFALRHLVHAAPEAVRVLSAMGVSPTAYRARLRVRAPSGEEAVLTFALRLMPSLEPRYRGAPRLEHRWMLTGVTGEPAASAAGGGGAGGAAFAPGAAVAPAAPHSSSSASSAAAASYAAAASARPPSSSSSSEQQPPPPPPRPAPAAALPPPSHPSPSFPPEAVVEGLLAALRGGRVAAAFALASPAAKAEWGPVEAFAGSLAPDGPSPLRHLLGHARAATVERMQASEGQYLARVRVLGGGAGGGRPGVWREFLFVVGRQPRGGAWPGCWMVDAIRPLFQQQQ